jgi:hypothetical protein
MKVLRYALMVLGICCFAIVAGAQEQEEEELPGFLSGRQEVEFEWCAVPGDVLYRMCTMQYDRNGEEYFYDERCSEWSPEQAATAYPQLCREFVATLEICHTEGSLGCYWVGIDSEPYILLPDFDGNGTTGLGDWVEFLLGWNIRWGIADYLCLSTWWHVPTPSQHEFDEFGNIVQKAPLVCAEDIR